MREFVGAGLDFLTFRVARIKTRLIKCGAQAPGLSRPVGGIQMLNKSLSRAMLGVAAITVLILIAIFVATQFISEFNWGGEDFAAAGGLIFFAGMAFVLAARVARNPRQRLVIGLAVLAGVALVWAELAVGIFT